MDQAELGVVDIRLGDVVRETGAAGAVGAGLVARRATQASGRLGRWLRDPLSVTGASASGGARASLSRASSSDYASNLDCPASRNATLLKVAGLALRLNPSRIHFRSGLIGSDAQRFTFLVPIAQRADTAPPAISRTRLWQNSGGVQLTPLAGVQLGVDAVAARQLGGYGGSTTVGRLIRQQRAWLFGSDVGLETQRLLTTSLAPAPRVAGGWFGARATVGSSFTFTRDPNARQPARTEGDTAGKFRVPAAFSNGRRIETGAQLDAHRLGQAIFGDSSALAAWLGRITGLDVSYSAQEGSTFGRATDAPDASYQLALGGFGGFRQVGGLLATAAAQTRTLSTGGAAILPLGLRANVTYRLTRGVLWTLRADEQVQTTTRAVDWPNGSMSWTVSPSRQLIGRILNNINIRVGSRP